MLKDCNSLLITCLEIDRFQDLYANFDIVSSMKISKNLKESVLTTSAKNRFSIFKIFHTLNLKVVSEH